MENTLKKIKIQKEKNMFFIFLNKIKKLKIKFLIF